jgi:hypothetical protein
MQRGAVKIAAPSTLVFWFHNTHIQQSRSTVRCPTAAPRPQRRRLEFRPNPPETPRDNGPCRAARQNPAGCDRLYDARWRPWSLSSSWKYRVRSAGMGSSWNRPYRRRCSSVKNPTGIEISLRPELQKINFCIMGRNSRFTRDFGLQKFVAKVHSSARTFAMARKFWTNQGGAR